MKAGSTDLEVGTMIRVTRIADKDEQDFLGVEGTITHPFPGLMSGPASSYIAGIRVTPESAAEKRVGGGRFSDPIINLCVGDEFEVIEPSEDIDPPAPAMR